MGQQYVVQDPQWEVACALQFYKAVFRDMASRLSGEQWRSVRAAHPEWQPLMPAVSTYVSTDVPKTISSNSVTVVTSTITIPQGGIITDLNVVNLSITYSWVNDLTVVLTSPMGTSVTLFQKICGSENNVDITFDDEGDSYANIPCPPTDGNAYQPYEALSAFDGQPSTGTWILTVIDDYPEDGGSLNEWGLEITWTPYEICDNSSDDDGDALVDGDDPDCACNSCFAPIVQEYYVPFPEDQVYQALTEIFPGASSCDVNVPEVGEPIYTVISISAYLDSTIIYFDHWEDDYEAQISDPNQSTTQIWGDGNPLNGVPPGVPDDIIMAGTTIILEMPVALSTRSSYIDFDGGDRFASSFPLAVTRAAWSNGPSTMLAGALEVYATDEWTTNYTFPIGENVSPSKAYFEVVGFVAMAAQDNTTLNIDLDADGTFETTLTLNQGESYWSSGVQSGGQLQASAPIQVHFITGDRCETYETRWFALMAQSFWSDNYYAPVAGGPQEYVLFNPHNYSVSGKIRLNDGSLVDFTIPANGNTTFQADSWDSGLHIYSLDGSSFYAMVLNDAISGASSNSAWDWGAPLLPLSKLTPQIAVGWAPGQDPTKPPSENGNPVWVTAAFPPSSNSTGSIQICVDYDGDNVGPNQDANGHFYDQDYTLDELDRVLIYDPDGDQSNMLVYVCDTVEAIISVIWGQDANTASASTPGLDVGTGVPGLMSFSAYKTVSLLSDADGDGQFSLGDTVQYSIGIANYGLVPIQGAFSVTDVFPPELSYVFNSTYLDDGNGNITPISDGINTPFPLDEGGIGVTLSLNPGQEGIISFNGVITTVPADSLITNVATVASGGISYTREVHFRVYPQAEVCDNGFDDDGDGITDCDCITDDNRIGGRIFQDANENMFFDSLESTYQGAILILYQDANGDGTLDAGDIPVDTATSSLNGNYYFAIDGSSFNGQISASADDAEEDFSVLTSGQVALTDVDLDLGLGYPSFTSATLVGMRFQGLTIPAGATITSAYVVFTANSNESGGCDLEFWAEDVDDASAFTTNNYNLSNRTRTSASVLWSGVPNWLHNRTYQTPDLAAIVQEVINCPGWQLGNDFVLLVEGTDRREAWSWDGNPAKAPRFVVHYSFFPAKFIVQLDTTSLPAAARMVTPTTAAVSFDAPGTVSCKLDFGYRLVEVCDNDIDDDGDGLTDCEDPECWTQGCIPESWDFACYEGTCVSVQGVGIKNNMPATLSFGDSASIYSIVVQATFNGSGGTPPDSIRFVANNGLSYTVGYQLFDNGVDRYFEAWFSPTSAVTVELLPGDNAAEAESFVAYVFHACENEASAGKFVHKAMYRETYTFGFTVPTSPVSRDLVVTVPLSEITNDGRIAVVTATAGPVTRSITIDTYNQGNSLNITPFTLEAVPGWVDSIAIVVESPTTNGQSLYLSGAGSVAVQCVPEFFLHKNANRSCAQLGDTVLYTYVLYNFGTDTLVNLDLHDDQLGAIGLSANVLPPQDSLLATATYIVQAADLPGPLVNVATATATDVGTGQELSTADTLSVPLLSLSLHKEVNVSLAHPGDTLSYTYILTNTGSAPLSLTLVDDRLGTLLPASLSNGLLAYYTFEAGSGDTVFDRSGIAPSLDLTINNPSNTTWVNGGLQIVGNTLISSVQPASKIIDAVKSSGAFSAAIWVTPANTTQGGPARILTLSANPYARNFTLGQEANEYRLRFRTTATTTNGMPELSSGAGTVATQLSHVVYTRDAAGNEALYVDGALVASGTRTGDASNWDNTYQLAFANELTNDRPWMGTLHEAAIYSRALSAVEIAQAYRAGLWAAPLVLAPGVTDTIAITYVVQGSDLPGPLVNHATIMGSYGDCAISDIDSASLMLCLPNIDFETDALGNPLSAGDTVFFDYVAWGLTVTTDNPTIHPPMIFDSGSPTGGDSDLGTPNQDFGGPGQGDGGRAGRIGQNDQPQGNVLIISEDYDMSDPDDNGSGGTLIFDFVYPTDVAYLQILDVDYGETEGRVRAYNCSGTLLVEKPIIAYGDNSLQTIVLDTTQVCKLVVDLAGSGAVAGIWFCESTPQTGTIGDLVWHDADGDGIQSVGEPGLANVVVELYDADNHLLATDTTDANGLYAFPDLMPGDYEVRVQTATLPTGFIPTYDPAGPLDHSSEVFALGAGQMKNDVDFGYKADCFDPSDLSLNVTNPLCFGDSTGTITTAVSGGTAPYTFLWNDGDTAQHRTHLPAGTYVLTVTDANGCVISDTAVLVDPPALSLSANVTDVDCQGNANGAMDVSVSGGTPPYQYAWSNGVNSEDLNGLSAGTYTLTVTDANGCTTSDSWTIIDEVVNFDNGGAIGSDETQCGGYDPAPIISLTLPSGGSGGTTIYQWQKDDGSGWTDITGATAATYDPPPITQTTSYRRKARRSPCTDWVVSNVVTKIVVNNPDDGGQIAGNESGCDSFDPTPITNITEPTCLYGTLTYQWQKDDGSGWTDIAGATAATYDPPLITTTTQYRRKARCVPCSDWVVSNVVTKTVVPTPEVVADTYAVCPNGSLSANVTDNDNYFATPQVILLDSTIHGSLTWQTNGQFDYQPQMGFCGTDQFVYVLCEVVGNNCCNTAQVVIEVADEEAPILQAVPTDTTISCTQAIPSAPILSATDNCDQNVAISLLENTTQTNNGSCSDYAYTITRTWIAVDVCGNTDTAMQTITVIDTLAPEFTVPSDVTISCELEASDLSLTGDVEDEWDSCDSTLGEATYQDSVLVDEPCAGALMIYRTWTLTDACGNSTSKLQRITVIDTLAPVLVGVPLDITVGCSSIPAVPLDVVATDNCDSEPELLYVQDSLPGTCVGEYTLIRRWVATDECGNSSMADQVIVVQDTEAPVITGVPLDESVGCEAVPAVPGVGVVVVTDNCDEAPVLLFTQDSISGGCVGSYTLVRRWIATDGCGNSSEAEQVIEVGDTDPPEITGVPLDITVGCSSIPAVPLDVVATDNCDSEPELLYVQDSLPGTCVGEYTLIRRWVATDECGNSSMADQVIVVQDTEAPIFLTMPADITVECDSVPPVPQVEAVDDCSEVTIELNEALYPQLCPDYYALIRTWTATDACGNTAVMEQTVIVQDTEAPVLEGVPQDISAGCNQIPDVPPPGTVTAIDNCSADVSIQFIEEVYPNDCGETIVRTWIATDACGNEGVATQTIVIGDDGPPQLIGVPADITVSCYQVPDPALVTAIDSCDVKVEVLLSETITPGDCLASYTLIRTWTATDDCGNVTQAVQKIEVVDDTPPLLGGIPADVTISCDEMVPVVPNDITAIDSCAGEMPLSFEETSVAMPCGMQLLRTWIATDLCGNTVTAQQTITVIDDEAPVLSGMPADLTINLGAGDTLPPPPIVTATDNCDPQPQITFGESQQSLPGGYQILYQWTAVDSCGNTSMDQMTVVVLEPIAAQIVVIQQALCGGGAFTLNALPASDTYTYLWRADSGFFDDSTAQQVTYYQTIPGVHQIQLTVSDPMGATGTATATVIVLEMPTVTPKLITPVCSGEPISLSANGTAETFTWTGPNGFEAVGAAVQIDHAAPQHAGWYYVQAKQDSCVLIDSVFVEVVDLSADLSLTVQAADCDGGGAISLSANGIYAPYTFNWADLPGTDDIQDRTELLPGTYSVTVTGNGCTIAFDEIEIVDSCLCQPPVLDSIAVQPATCEAADGLVQLWTNNPDQLVSNWIPDVGMPLDGALGRSHLPKGTYQVILSVAGQVNCDTTLIVQVDSHNPLIADVQIVQQSTCAQANGQVAIMPLMGGTGPYTYLWNDGQQLTDSVRTGLLAGTYQVTVVDQGTQCADTVLFTLTDAAIGQATVLVEAAWVSCPGMADAWVNYSIHYDSTFVAPPTVIIVDEVGNVYENGQLPPGNYCIEVLDGNYCLAGEGCFPVFEPPALEATVTTLPQICTQLGQIILELSGGTPPYLFTWSDLDTVTTQFARDSLAAGTYDVTISDANGCGLVLHSLVVADSCEVCQTPVIENIEVAMADCGQANGHISIDMVGNASLYTFTWSPAIAMGPEAHNVSPGIYSVTIARASDINCDTTIQILVNTEDGPQPANIEVQPASCGASDGQVRFMPMNYIYQWMADNEVAPVRDDLAAGIYVVAAYDPLDLSCFTLLEVVVPESDMLSAELVVVQQPHCQASDGIVSVTIDGGSGSFQFDWSDGLSANEALRDSLSAGSWIVTITDLELGCAAELTVEIEETLSLASLSANDVQVSCFGMADAFADYTYELDTSFVLPASIEIRNALGQLVEDGHLGVGAYCITLFDGNQCEVAQACFEVAQPDPLELTAEVSGASCAGGGSIELTVSGGTGGYAYDWQDLPGVDDPKDREDVLAGTYVVVVRDSVGCSDTLVVDVPDECSGGGGCNQPVVVSVSTTPAYCGMAVGTATIELSNDSLGFDYTWHPEVSTGPEATGLLGGIYEVRISDPSAPDSCFVKVMIEILSTSAPEVVAEVSGASCAGGGSIELTVSGGTGGYVYDWQDLPGVDDPKDREDVLAGTYVVVVRDSVGCSDTLVVDVPDECVIPPGGTVDTIFVVTEMNTPQVFCPADSVEVVMISIDVCGMPLNGMFVLSDSCIQYVPNTGYIGVDSACVLVCDSSAICDTVAVFIEVNESTPCTALFVEAKDTLWAVACEEAWYCVPVPFMELDDYKIYDNDFLFSGRLVACDFDSTMTYTFTALPGGGYEGPYHLQHWEVDGQVFAQTIFEDINELVSWMNQWDPAGHWMLDVTTQTISGGVAGRAYGDLVIRQMSSGAIAVLTLNLNLVPQGTELLLSSGFHQLVVKDLATGCSDTVQVQVNCTQVTTLTDTVGLGLADTLCIDISWMPGDSIFMQNICPDQFGELVLLDFLPPNCIVFQGIAVGSEQACIAICDEMGYCDTLYVSVDVIPGGSNPMANDDQGTTWLEQTIELEILLNDTINGMMTDLFLLDPPAFGTVSVNSDGTATYQPNGSDCDPIQPDQFTYVLCNEVSCDTATVYVTVDCEEFIIFSGFSPNGDGINDFFTIRGVERLPGNHLLIFNRWGNQVYEAYEYKNDWDGTWNGKDLPDGTYFYIFEDGRGNKFTGYVQINR